MVSISQFHSCNVTSTANGIRVKLLANVKGSIEKITPMGIEVHLAPLHLSICVDKILVQCTSLLTR